MKTNPPQLIVYPNILNAAIVTRVEQYFLKLHWVAFAISMQKS